MLRSLSKSQSRGAEIKLPSRAGAEITNCGSGSFLVMKGLKKFYRKKSLLLKKFLNIITILILFRYNMHKYILKCTGTVLKSKKVIANVSADLEPKEIFLSAPQRRF